MCKPTQYAELPKDPFYDRPYLMCTSTINHQSYVDDSKLHLTFPVKAIDTPTRQITEDLKKDFSRGAAKCACISGDMLPHHHHFLCKKKKISDNFFHTYVYIDDVLIFLEREN